MVDTLTPKYSQTYLRGLEVAELKEKDIPVV